MNPVENQPQQNTVSQGTSSNWQTGMFDFLDDYRICLCGTFCAPCLSCEVANDMNEFFLCGWSVSMRTLYRTKYNIPGSIFSDFMWLTCCPNCALCQLKRDIEKRKAMNAF